MSVYSKLQKYVKIVQYILTIPKSSQNSIFNKIQNIREILLAFRSLA